jgi:hypothetical protein
MTVIADISAKPGHNVPVSTGRATGFCTGFFPPLATPLRQTRLEREMILFVALPAVPKTFLEHDSQHLVPDHSPGSENRVMLQGATARLSPKPFTLDSSIFTFGGCSGSL